MKYILVIIMVGLCCFGLSQITSVQVAPPEGESISAPYDSTRNYLGNDAGQYVGQILYVKGKPLSYRDKGYLDFFVDYKKSTWYNDKSNIYKPDAGKKSITSRYDAIAGKYFRVISVIRDPEELNDRVEFRHTYFLELEEIESGDKLYYKYNSLFDISFPFLVVGFYEKQKKTFANQRMILADELLDGVHDIHTGVAVSNSDTHDWTCKDLTIDEDSYKLGLVLENEVGDVIFIPFDDIKRSDSRRRGFSENEFNELAEKFGHDKMESILQGKVKVGFTEEMARMAWGEPSDINRSSYGDQWVYHSQYLYFENGILTAFN